MLINFWRYFVVTKHSKLYSETMRELSLLDEDSLKLYQMRWGLIDVDEVIVSKVGFAVYNNIPPATPVAKNAMLQIMASYENSFDRKEWADRIEGKATQTTVNVNHDTKDGVEELKNYTKAKLDELFGDM